ncbi:hypothetical protein SAMN05216374_4815 [Tardiphaga sp. OK246]|nr:hypothetical protein SAMN05216374_4815 [Tardiphaga sp. OK246]
MGFRMLRSETRASLTSETRLPSYGPAYAPLKLEMNYSCNSEASSGMSIA